MAKKYKSAGQIRAMTMAKNCLANGAVNNYWMFCVVFPHTSKYIRYKEYKLLQVMNLINPRE
jgi:hypothetical protein